MKIFTRCTIILALTPTWASSGSFILCHEIVFEIENVLASGDYHVNIAAASGNDLLLKQSTVYQFQVRKAKLYDQSLTHPRISVKLI